jgi:preprotein translocase subunit SecG
MLFTFLLVVQTLVAASLVAVILMQRSEGGGLGVGGSSSGFMTARGAADFLSRSTAVLATIFIILAIALAALAGVTRKPATIDTSLVNQTGSELPVTGAPVPVQQQAPANQAAPANQSAPAVPLQQ